MIWAPVSVMQLLKAVRRLSVLSLSRLKTVGLPKKIPLINALIRGRLTALRRMKNSGARTSSSIAPCSGSLLQPRPTLSPKFLFGSGTRFSSKETLLVKELQKNTSQILFVDLKDLTYKRYQFPALVSDYRLTIWGITGDSAVLRLSSRGNSSWELRNLIFSSAGDLLGVSKLSPWTLQYGQASKPTVGSRGSGTRPNTTVRS